MFAAGHRLMTIRIPMATYSHSEGFSWFRMIRRRAGSIISNPTLDKFTVLTLKAVNPPPTGPEAALVRQSLVYDQQGATPLWTPARVELRFSCVSAGLHVDEEKRELTTPPRVSGSRRSDSDENTEATSLSASSKWIELWKTRMKG